MERRTQPYLQRTLLYLVSILFAGACIEPYTPKLTKTDSNILVVHGFLNVGDGSCKIQLSRSEDLNNNGSAASVADAQVSVKSDDGANYPLHNYGSGSYATSGLSLNQAKKYFLQIAASDGQLYESDQVPVKQTPPIDSVTWEVDSFHDGVNIYVNTHDPSNATRYYLWDFVETWRYATPFQSTVEYEGTQIVARKNDIANCYTTAQGTKIVIGTSEKLSSDVIRQALVTAIPQVSVKLRIRYSILVREYALTKEAFDYWQSIKKNNENLGTLFAPLPSQLTGNIHSVSSSKPVIGYFSAFSVSEKRIFIDRNQLPHILRQTGYETCESDTLLVAYLPRPVDIPKFVRIWGLITPLYSGPQLIGYLRADWTCVDCTLRGGTTVKPDFWQ